MADKLEVYEGMFIFDANRHARDRAALPREVENMVNKAGGEMEVSRLWEERRLAYPINGQRKGAYWITYFRLPTSKVGEITRQCEITDGILRQLFVRLPAALVEPILDHAKGAGVEQPADDAPAAESSENGKPAETPAKAEPATAAAD